MAARRSILTTFALAAIAAASGCRNCELVEAELRHQNRKVEELQAELTQAQSECQMLRSTVQHLSSQTSANKPASTPDPVRPDAGAPRLRPDAKSGDGAMRGAYYPPESRSSEGCKLVIGQMSREKDFDADGKSDGLTLNFSLVDRDGDPAKLPGSAVVEVFESMTNGRMRAIGVWEFDETQLRRFWRSGVFGSGYQLTFGWQRPPSTESVRAVVHYRLDDGQDFEASKDLRVFLSPRLQWLEAASTSESSP